MMSETPEQNAHGKLMDATYRHMKYVYDWSRPFFLAGRADLRRKALDGQPERICEVGCGTARNLILMAPEASPETKLTGLDMSGEMVRFAKDKVQSAGLSTRIDIRLQDFFDYLAEDNGPATFVFSYSLSMIPNWQDMLRAAANACHQNSGRIVIADFSTMERWPHFVRERLRKNMRYFHVSPRYDLMEFLEDNPAFEGATIKRSAKFGGYAAVITVTF